MITSIVIARVVRKKMRASEIGEQIINIIFQVGGPVFAFSFDFSRLFLHLLFPFFVLLSTPLHVQALIQLFLQLLHQVGVFDVYLLWDWLWLVDGARTLLEEC